jgi:single-strand DNA-binding protein
MADRNFFELDCRMTRDMEIKYTNAGKSIASFGVCYNESYKKGDEWIKKANFFDCSAFGKTAEAGFKKGELVHIEGSLAIDSWEREGQKHSKVNLKVFKIEPLDNGNRSPRDNSPTGPQGSPTPRSSPPQAPRPQPAYAEASQGEDSEIPF